MTWLSRSLSAWVVAIAVAACGPKLPSHPSAAPDAAAAPQPAPPDPAAVAPAPRGAEAVTGGARDPSSPPLGAPLVAPPPAPDHARWIVAGGGASPVDNQVSIEEDLGLAADTFGGEGVLLYAGGAGTHGVQVLDERQRGDRLTALLGDLFDPRGGRNTHYRPTRLAPNGPASAERLLDALAGALAHPGDGPLTVYLAGHGVPAQRPRDAQLSMWGGRGLVPADLAAALDRNPAGGREVRVVMTSCFSGAFADLLFTAADPTEGPARPIRCGLFAAPWDRPSSGCDPDPDGRRQGYGAQLLRALTGAAPGADLDHDGHVSLLEAHTHVRTLAAGFDVPTTTSERWLRAVAAAQGWPEQPADPDPAPSAPLALPEEDAVVAALGARLGERDEAAVGARVKALQDRLAERDRAVAEASEREADAGDRIAAATLARWPVLDDPWHPDYAATLATERRAIEDWFQVHADYHAYLAARDETDLASGRRDAVVLELGPWLSLQRALVTRRLAGHLAARGGPDLATFEALRACERGLAP